jgi:hypothetical protein
VSKRKRNTPKKVDPTILAELLEQPGVKEHVEKMTPRELTWCKELLVSRGIYAQYVKERKERVS